jgi:hypothetical protein
MPISANEKERIYHLIQDDRIDEAIRTLRPAVIENPDDEDLWWLLANAVDDPAEARNALDNVLRINPNNYQAQELTQKLNEAYPIGVTEDDFFSDLENNPVPELVATPKRTPTVTLDDDPFDDLMTGIEPDTTPDFVNEMDKTAEPAPKFEQPEVFPEPFMGVRLDQRASEALKAEQLAAANTPVVPVDAASVSPASTGIKMAPPLSDDEEENQTSPLLSALLGLMLLVVIGLGAYYFLSRPADPAASTVTPTLAVAANVTQLPTGVPSGGDLTPSPLPATAIPAATIETGVIATPTLAPENTGIPGTNTAPTLPPPPTAQATVNVDLSSTPAAPSATPATPARPLSESLTLIAESFKAANFADAEVTLGESLLGKTLTVKACTRTGPALAQNTNRVRDLLAEQAYPYAGELSALSAILVNCNAKEAPPLYNRIVPIQVAKAFVENKVDVTKYRGSWINP